MTLRPIFAAVLFALLSTVGLNAQESSFKTVEALEPEFGEHFDLIRKSHGVIEDEFAYCHTMPIEEFVSLANRLATINYRVTRVRPFASSTGEYYVAAVWRRDRIGWYFYVGKKLKEIREFHAEREEMAYMPIDVGSYSGGAAYYAIWRKVDDPDMRTTAYFGLSDAEYAATLRRLAGERRVMILHQKVTNSSGRGLHCLVARPAVDSDAHASFEGDARAYAKALAADSYQLDLSMVATRGRLGYLAQTVKNEKQRTHVLFEKSLAEHFKLCKEHAADGLLPRVLNVRVVRGKPIASSVWVSRDDPMID